MILRHVTTRKPGVKADNFARKLTFDAFEQSMSEEVFPALMPRRGWKLIAPELAAVFLHLKTHKHVGFFTRREWVESCTVARDLFTTSDKPGNLQDELLWYTYEYALCRALRDGGQARHWMKRMFDVIEDEFYDQRPEASAAVDEVEEPEVLDVRPRSEPKPLALPGTRTPPSDRPLPTVLSKDN